MGEEYFHAWGGLRLFGAAQLRGPTYLVARQPIFDGNLVFWRITHNFSLNLRGVWVV